MLKMFSLDLILRSVLIVMSGFIEGLRFKSIFKYFGNIGFFFPSALLALLIILAVFNKEAFLEEFWSYFFNFCYAEGFFYTLPLGHA